MILAHSSPFYILRCNIIPTILMKFKEKIMIISSHIQCSPEGVYVLYIKHLPFSEALQRGIYFIPGFNSKVILFI